MELPESQFVSYFMVLVDEKKPPVKAPVEPIVEIEMEDAKPFEIVEAKPKPKRRKLNVD